MALNKAIGAAVGRNKLYSSNNKIKERIDCKKYWKEFLISIGSKYKDIYYDESQYLIDIEFLKCEMNKRFSRIFVKEEDIKIDLDSGFRISHAQKSISVYLKHLWCMGLFGTPPQCLIDRKILSSILKNKYVSSWIKVNSIESHGSLVQIIKIVAEIDGCKSIAIWELLNY
jgi:hypothetical protein